MVGFTLLSLYPQGSNPRYPLCRRLGGPKIRSGRHGKENNRLPLPGNEPRLLGCPARQSLVDRLNGPGISGFWDFLHHRYNPLESRLNELQSFFFKFIGLGWNWVHLVRRPLTDLLYQPRMIDDECGAVRWMRIGRGSRSTQRKL
jgi:hypothetical protein